MRKILQKIQIQKHRYIAAQFLTLLSRYKKCDLFS